MDALHCYKQLQTLVSLVHAMSMADGITGNSTRVLIVE